MIKSLSIIFPVFNEGLRLKSSFSHIKIFLKKEKKLKPEIIFVDEGSEDNNQEGSSSSNNEDEIRIELQDASGNQKTIIIKVK